MSWDHPLVATLDVNGKGQESYLHTVKSNKAKHEQLILCKTYPTKVTINN
jgi:competence protein ComGF